MLPPNVLIDDEDRDLLKEYKNWFISKRGDVYTQVWANSKAKSYKLHRVIMNCPPGLEVDHINHNRLDNRRANLRICTHAENGRNLSLKKNNKSGFRGVHWDKSRNRWVPKIKLNFKDIYLGRFTDLQDAIRVRKEAEIKYFGEYAPWSEES